MRARFALFFLPLLLLPTALSSALPEPDPPVRYTLSPSAGYEEGCYAPCMCPILITSPVVGAFALDRFESDDDWTTYAVSEIAWEVYVLDELFHQTGGEGVYRVDPTGKLQQMILDLQVDGRDPIRFDSGIVAVEVEWPALAVTVSRNNMWCYDEVYFLRAAPAGTITVETEPGWGAIKARW